MEQPKTIGDLLKMEWVKPDKKPKFGRGYTPYETKIIKQFYPKGKARLVKEHLPDRSMHSIRKKAEKLGLGSPNVRWHRKDELILIDLYRKSNSSVEITHELNRICGSSRTKGAVVTKFYELSKRPIVSDPPA
jgi:hypothetical protein